MLRGSLLAIPIEDSLIYVQPIYLSAEQGALPELRRVIVAFGNQIAMEPTLEQSIQRIFGARIRGEEGVQPRGAEGNAGGIRRLDHAGPAGPAGVGSLAEGQEALRRGDWAAYGQAQKQVEETPSPAPRSPLAEGPIRAICFVAALGSPLNVQEYASRPAFGRRLASGPFSALCVL